MIVFEEGAEVACNYKEVGVQGVDGFEVNE